MDLIKYSAKDCYGAVQSTIMTVMKRLNYVLQLDVSCAGSWRSLTLLCLQSQLGASGGADRQHLADVASLLCATLQTLLRKVNAEDATTVSDTVMQALLMMFLSSSGQTGGVQEDALMTVGVLVEGRLHWLGGGAYPYDFMQLSPLALRNTWSSSGLSCSWLYATLLSTK